MSIKIYPWHHLEQQVWSDIQTFLRNPLPVLEQLHARLQTDVKGTDQIQKQVTRLEGLLAQKTTERTRVVALFRRGRLTDADLDAQMDEVGREETALQAQLAELRAKVVGAESIGTTITSARDLLEKLERRLDGPLSFEQKRRLIEVLVAGIRVDNVETCGVKQAAITVTYRFSEPDQPMPVVMAQSYTSGKVMRIPIEPKTVGDHLRKRRLELKLLQKNVATQLGVSTACYRNWEGNTAEPVVRYVPAIIAFLGYNPLPEAKAWGERLVRCRTTLGLTQKEAAARIGVDQGTLARWERGEREPSGTFLNRVGRFLKGSEDREGSAARSAG